jgi:hypothetical protein
MTVDKSDVKLFPHQVPLAFFTKSNALLVAKFKADGSPHIRTGRRQIW